MKELLIIAEWEAGSSAHGIALKGMDDRDYLGIFVGNPSSTFGIQTVDTKEERTKPRGVPSEPGDIDKTFHSLRKFCRLALRGNPTIFNFFFTPEYFFKKLDERAKNLKRSVSYFVSLSVAQSFLGYLTNQRQRMDGSRGRKGKVRFDLVKRYGYDTKYASHAIRLGFQGLFFCDNGTIPIPLAGRQRDLVLSVKRGEVSELKALNIIDLLRDELKESILANRLQLPLRPDMKRVEDIMTEMYLEYWKNWALI